MLAVVLIYGIGPFAGWGVVGAGIATAIAQTAQTLFFLWLVWDDLAPLLKVAVARSSVSVQTSKTSSSCTVSSIRATGSRRR